MEFGHVVDNLDGVNFSLPPDDEMTRKTLGADEGVGELKIHVGCTKWAHKGWLGQIYPVGTKDADFLTEYAKQFNTIELGATFYTIQGPAQILQWKRKAEGNPEFKFCPKFAQNITHIRRLRNAEELTKKFYEGIRTFDQLLGPTMLQLGENFSPKSFTELKAYLESLPKDVQVFVELRHKDWFAIPQHKESLFTLLNEQNVGAVISDSAGRRDCVHMTLPTPHAMIRFVGNNLHQTDYTRIDDWVNRIESWRDQGLQSLYFFMHQHDENNAPILCDYLIKQLNEKLGTSIKGPLLISL